MAVSQFEQSLARAQGHEKAGIVQNSVVSEPARWFMDATYKAWTYAACAWLLTIALQQMRPI
jgi:hypothetical protein